MMFRVKAFIGPEDTNSEGEIRFVPQFFVEAEFEQEAQAIARSIIGPVIGRLYVPVKREFI